VLVTCLVGRLDTEYKAVIFGLIDDIDFQHYLLQIKEKAMF
jgi:hypothetical protein